MVDLWRSFLVAPLLDLLIFFYETIAFGNLGLAVIEMTFLLRLALIPLTIKAERDAARYEHLEAQVADIQERFKYDEVLAGEHIRAFLKEHKVSHWAKAMILFLQLIVMIVLYQVFQRGIYGGFNRPINTTFFGAELGARNFYWSLAVGLLLLVEITFEQRKVAHLLQKKDAVYRYAFPAFTVVVLSILPMAKSLFVLTSMVFSLTVSNLRRALWPTDSTK
jgi:YidC/Oxa1 family membrane protein insertase